MSSRQRNERDFRLNQFSDQDIPTKFACSLHSRAMQLFIHIIIFMGIVCNRHNNYYTGQYDWRANDCFIHAYANDCDDVDACKMNSELKETEHIPVNELLNKNSQYFHTIEEKIRH